MIDELHDRPMKVLFLCTHNACRSILAEAIARKIGGARWEVASAGSHPAGRVHPLTLHYLERAGYDTIGLQSKSWDDLQDFQPDIVITVCDQAAGEVCPVWFGKAIKAHWGLSDPSRDTGDPTETEKAFAYTIRLLEGRLSALQKIPLKTLPIPELQALLTHKGASN